MTEQLEGICPECRGTGSGQFDHNRNAPCDACHGTGLAPKADPKLRERVADLELYSLQPDGSYTPIIWDKENIDQIIALLDNVKKQERDELLQDVRTKLVDALQGVDDIHKIRPLMLAVIRGMRQSLKEVK